AEKVEIVHTDIDCRPCFQRECQYEHLKCLTELSPKQVLDSIQKLDAITISSC
ncbi:lipopolysaccharide heptosyltransferase II, partial [Vibrio parahaemolyticus]|nr:lipopolysaccharide heptosyltransferase II [Vibrio parahaemolyticus]